MAKKENWIIDVGNSYMEFWLKDKRFRKTVWTDNSPIGNHEHCLFCGKEITSCDCDYETEKQAYASTTGWVWLCTECFEEFSKYHKLPLVVNTVEMVENALREQKTVIFSYNNERYIIKNKENKISVLHNESEKLYEDVLTMERSQRFYGKPLRDVMEDLYMSIV